MRGARTPGAESAPVPAFVEPATRSTQSPSTHRDPPLARPGVPRPFLLQTATAEGLRESTPPSAPARTVPPGLPSVAAVVTSATKPTVFQPDHATPTNGARPPDRIVAPAAHRPPARPEADHGPITSVLATATFVTGTARLEPGRRYGIAICGERFQVLGPVDIDARLVALERPVADINVSALEGRLVVSEQKRSGVVLAFMSVAGAGLDELAGAIREASQDAQT